MVSSRAGIPDHSSALMPRLFCRDPDAAIRFYVQALGAEELGRRPDAEGRTSHALLALSGAMFMVEAEWPGVPNRAPDGDGSSAVALFVYVTDVDAVVARALAAGARLLIPAANQFWGDRTAWILDPAGHVWTVASRVEDTTEAEREARWSDIVAGGTP